MGLTFVMDTEFASQPGHYHQDLDSTAASMRQSEPPAFKVYRIRGQLEKFSKTLTIAGITYLMCI
jgi:hypothetical protein